MSSIDDRRDRKRKSLTLPQDVIDTLEQQENQSAFVERAVRRESESYHRRAVARAVVGRMTELVRASNGGELPREFRVIQSELLDEFDVFQNGAEVTMSRDELSGVSVDE